MTQKEREKSLLMQRGVGQILEYLNMLIAGIGTNGSSLEGTQYMQRTMFTTGDFLRKKSSHSPDMISDDKR